VPLLSPEQGWGKKIIEASTKNSTGNIYIRTEVVWMNQHFLRAVETKRVPIELTDKEKELGKLNPERD
jgi:DNA adenine methylase